MMSSRANKERRMIDRAEIKRSAARERLIRRHNLKAITRRWLKRTDISTPYAIFEAEGWTWHVLQAYQTPIKERANPYPVWYCAVKPPYTIQLWERVNVYISDIPGATPGRRLYTNKGGYMATLREAQTIIADYAGAFDEADRDAALKTITDWHDGSVTPWAHEMAQLLAATWTKAGDQKDTDIAEAAQLVEEALALIMTDHAEDRAHPL